MSSSLRGKGLFPQIPAPRDLAGVMSTGPKSSPSRQVWRVRHIYLCSLSAGSLLVWSFLAFSILMINERATTSSYFHTTTTMKFTVLLAAFAASALGGTIYMAGDSTMATGGWHGLRYCRYALYAEPKSDLGQLQDADPSGWGEYVATYTTSTVSSQAVAGRSARS